MSFDVHGADGERGKRVLMISTGSRFAQGFALAEQSVLETLRRLGPGQIEFHSEALDIVRFPSESYRRLFRNYLSEKYADYPPDLLILIYVGNLRVAEELFQKLFPGVPVVVAGFTEEEISVSQLGPHVSGVAQRVDPRGTIELIFRLQPDTRRIVVIGGTAEVDRHVISRAKEAARSFPAPVEFDFWTDRPMAEMSNAVKSLPPRTAILFTRMFRDGAGRAFNSTQAAQLIAQSANVPVYIMTDTMFGTGAVGGSVADVKAMAQRAGEVAHRILIGAAPASPSLEIRAGGVPTFDWQALRRWGISESRLPPASIVRNRPQSVWAQYRWYIIGALVVMALQAAIIADLLLNRARRRRAEAELRESREFMEMATEAGQMGLWVRDMVRDDLWANPRLRSLFGVGEDDALGIKDIQARIHSDDREQIVTAIERAQKTGVSFDVEFRTAISSVPERWLVARGRMIRDLQGRPQRTMGTVIDITERKLNEERLRQSEQSFRTLVETTSAVPWTADMQTLTFTYVGPQAANLLGYPLEQWYEKDFWVSHLHPEDREFAINARMALGKGARDFEFDYRMVASSGKTVWVHDIVNCENRAGEPEQLRGFFLDISARKQTEAALAQSENQVRLFVEHTPASVAMFDREMRYVLTSRRWLKDYNLGEQDVIGRSHYDVFPEISQRWKEIHQRCLAGAVETCEQDPFPRLDGKLDWVRWEVRPWYGAADEIGGILMFTEVITERKQAEAELELQRAELAHMTRISTMGELAASLAHELNQPLTAILSNAQAAQRFLAAEPADLSEVREILADIVEDDTRAGEVIRRMRRLVKKEELEFTPLDMGAVIADVVLLAHSDALLRNIRVSHEIDPHLRQVRGDRVQLQQVLLNLLLNAFDAMHDCPPNRREIHVRAARDGGRMVEIAVADHGAGLTGDKLEKIFQPFYTTKRGGLGLGLSISRSIIEAHGGRLWAKNNEERGATFYFTVPMEKNIERQAGSANDQVG